MTNTRRSSANQRLGPPARCGAAADAAGTATGGGTALTLAVEARESQE
jgi:hypothetical protein